VSKTINSITDAVALNRGLLEWSNGKFNERGSAPLLGRHCLHDLNIFSDEVLVDLLDRYPRNKLQAWTMGTDPLRREDWTAVDTTGLSGEQLLAAVKSGRIWYNILRLDLFDPLYRNVADRLYAEMAEVSPGFRPLSIVATLLLSSPHAQVYYHADGPPTTLFHIRGRKRFWVYPRSERFVSQTMLEEIYGSAMDEEIPYSPEFDRDATLFELNPGDMIWWPHNAPHRIENLDSLNVSLSTRYQTDDSERRKLVYNANRFFRRKLGFRSLSTQETGIACSFKCLAYRMCRKVGLREKATGYVYRTNLRIDPNGIHGLSVLPELVTPPFSR
jgi:hypothetical protein